MSSDGLQFKQRVLSAKSTMLRDNKSRPNSGMSSQTFLRKELI